MRRFLPLPVLAASLTAVTLTGCGGSAKSAIRPPTDSQAASASATHALSARTLAPTPSARPSPVNHPVSARKLQHVIVAGDSIPEDFGPMIANTLNGPQFQVHTESHPSTGLVRDDFYDWPAAAKRIAAEHPDTVILQMGGNDVQPVKLASGTYATPASPEWTAEYARRAAVVLDALRDGGVPRVYWLTMPTTTRSGMNPAIADMGQALKAAAKGRKGVTVYDSDVLLGANAGTPAAHQPDGIHFSILGSQMISNAMIGRLRLDLGSSS